MTVPIVSVDLEARAELIALGSRATPTIKVGDDVLIGFNPSKLTKLLGKSPTTGPLG